MTWSTVCFFRKLCTHTTQTVHLAAVSMLLHYVPAFKTANRLLPGCVTMQSKAAVWPRVLDIGSRQVTTVTAAELAAGCLLLPNR